MKFLFLSLFVRENYKLALVLALASCFRLLLALYAGLLVMFSLAKFSEYAGSCTLSLKTTERAVQCFVFFNSDLCHLYSLPPQIQMRMIRKNIICIIIHDFFQLVKRIFIFYAIFFKFSFLALEKGGKSVLYLQNFHTMEARMWYNEQRYMYIGSEAIS